MDMSVLRRTSLIFWPGASVNADGHNFFSASFLSFCWNCVLKMQSAIKTLYLGHNVSMLKGKIGIHAKPFVQCSGSGSLNLLMTWQGH